MIPRSLRLIVHSKHESADYIDSLAKQFFRTDLEAHFVLKEGIAFTSRIIHPIFTEGTEFHIIGLFEGWKGCRKLITAINEIFVVLFQQVISLIVMDAIDDISNAAIEVIKGVFFLWKKVAERVAILAKDILLPLLNTMWQDVGGGVNEAIKIAFLADSLIKEGIKLPYHLFKQLILEGFQYSTSAFINQRKCLTTVFNVTFESFQILKKHSIHVMSEMSSITDSVFFELHKTTILIDLIFQEILLNSKFSPLRKSVFEIRSYLLCGFKQVIKLLEFTKNFLKEIKLSWGDVISTSFIEVNDYIMTSIKEIIKSFKLIIDEFLEISKNLINYSYIVLSVISEDIVRLFSEIAKGLTQLINVLSEACYTPLKLTGITVLEILSFLDISVQQVQQFTDEQIPRMHQEFVQLPEKVLLNINKELISYSFVMSSETLKSLDQINFEISEFMFLPEVMIKNILKELIDDLITGKIQFKQLNEFNRLIVLVGIKHGVVDPVDDRIQNLLVEYRLWVSS